MLANHRSQFKTIQLRHAYVHQHYGNVDFQKKFKGLLRRSRLDQVLAKFAQHNLVAEQLGRLIIDHQNIDPFVRAHCSLREDLGSQMPAATTAICVATYAAMRAVVRYLRVWPGTPTHQLPDTSRDLLSLLLRSGQ